MHSIVLVEPSSEDKSRKDVEVPSSTQSVGKIGSGS